jgi:hypothetical protein
MEMLDGFIKELSRSAILPRQRKPDALAREGSRGSNNNTQKNSAKKKQKD